jgi:glutaredoxin
MKNKIIIAIVIIIVLAGAAFLVFKKNTPSPTIEGMILFYRDGCEYCENVDKYVQDNKVEEKINFQRLEVSKNSGNAQVLVQKAQACGLPTDQIGVPFFWDGSKCIVGDQDIIAFFQEKIK